MKIRVKIVLSMLFLVAAFSAQSQTLTPFNIQVNSAGSEVIADYLLSYPDGSQEVFTAHFGDNVFQVAGSATIPSVWNLALETSVRNQGIGGPPYYDPQGIGVPESSSRVPGSGGSFGSHLRPGSGGAETEWVNIVIYAGGLAVTAGACTAGWFATRRALISSCRAQGRGWDSITVGRCGIAGSSSIDCEDEESEGDEEENSNILSWHQFASSHLPWTYNIDNYIFQLRIPSDDGF